MKKRPAYRYFKKRVKYWLQRFALQDWSVYYAHAEIEHMAECASHKEGKVATITLSSTWDSVKYTQSEVDAAALHEVLELLLADLDDLARTRYVSESELETERHRVIRRMEHALGVDKQTNIR